MQIATSLASPLQGKTSAPEAGITSQGVSSFGKNTTGERGKIHSMNSTNANSGSEGGYQSLELSLPPGENEGPSFSAKKQPSSGMRAKKDNSVMHPSSPSKIKMDESPNRNYSSAHP